MPYDFYLDKCLLPVPPPKLQVTVNNNNKTMYLINEGEINILKSPGLTDIRFECEIPQIKYPFACYKNGYKDASYFLDYFEKLKLIKRPFQFIAARISPAGKILVSTNIRVSMENYSVTESAENSFDFIVDISLKQFRDYSAKSIKLGDYNSENKAREIKTRPPSSTADVPLTIGSDVIINGRLFKNSYGAAPGKTLTNYKGKINFINLSGSHPYHVTTPSGAWLGWVLKDSLKAVT